MNPIEEMFCKVKTEMKNLEESMTNVLEDKTGREDDEVAALA